MENRCCQYTKLTNHLFPDFYKHHRRGVQLCEPPAPSPRRRYLIPLLASVFNAMTAPARDVCFCLRFNFVFEGDGVKIKGKRNEVRLLAIDGGKKFGTGSFHIGKKEINGFFYGRKITTLQQEELVYYRCQVCTYTLTGSVCQHRRRSTRPSRQWTSTCLPTRATYTGIDLESQTLLGDKLLIVRS